MRKILRFFPTWLPAIIMMAAIFAFSGIPSESMPDYDWADLFVKKGGHLLGYGILGFAYLYAFEFNSSKIKLAWLLAILYAMTDEFHQSFVAGRMASWIDVAIDGIGAALALLFVKRYLKEIAAFFTDFLYS